MLPGMPDAFTVSLAAFSEGIGFCFVISDLLWPALPIQGHIIYRDDKERNGFLASLV